MSLTVRKETGYAQWHPRFVNPAIHPRVIIRGNVNISCFRHLNKQPVVFPRRDSLF